MRADGGSAATGTSSRLLEPLRDGPLTAYVLLAVVLSWAWWVPVALAGGTASHVPGLLGPLVAAVLVSAATGGREALRRLRGRFGAFRWWLLALTPALVGALAAVVAQLVGHRPSWGDFAVMPGVPEWPWPVVVLVLLVVGGLGEEVGWRGSAWTRLRRHLDLRDAALVLTIPWAVWHLPLFWIDSGLAGLSPLVVPGWLLGLASGSVVLGWLYERSGSLLVVALAHTAVNVASGTRGGEGPVAAAVTVGVIAAATAVLAAARRGGRTGSPGSGAP
ncbi:CPBP family intramembrane glutamic endopeptidase [Blastococcus sp. SYSU D01042]